VPRKAIGRLQSYRVRASEWPALEFQLLLHSDNFVKQCARLVARVQMPGNTERLPICQPIFPRYSYVRPATSPAQAGFVIHGHGRAGGHVQRQRIKTPWSLIILSYVSSAVKRAERRYDVVPPGNTNCRTAPHTLRKCARHMLRPASGTWRLKKTYVMYGRCLCPAARFFPMYKSLESKEEEETEAWLGSRSNLQEIMNASWLRGIGGVKMQLDIYCAITEEATELVCQMVTAVSQRKGLLKRSTGPLSEERAAREEGHKKKVKGFRVDLEEKREKERSEKENEERKEEQIKRAEVLRRKLAELKEGTEERRMLEVLKRGGFLTQLAWLERIESATVKRRTFFDLSGDDERGTHSADTMSVERKSKRKMGIVDSGGTEVDVLEVCGDLTEEDLEKQAEEIEKHKKRKVGGGEKRDMEEGDDDVMNWTAEAWKRYKRNLEEMREEEEEMREKRKETDRRREKRERRGKGDGEEKDESEEEEEEEGEDENAEKDEEEEKVVGDGMGENGGMEEEMRGLDTLLRNAGQKEIQGKHAGKFVREWGLARLKGNDAGQCCGVVDNRACQRDFNGGVKSGNSGNLVLLK
jgi:hypothetical protein